ncbi:MAG: entericidin A/B family lipoprotein [Candidatus Hydrogenedentes bacterium]|nr:entericidin A/B family lipoprotein [Candidatus Hydrogenedentota bacterium]
MNKLVRMAAAILVGILLSVGILGCNTFRGVGKDLQRGGQAIENTAEKVQQQ